MSVINQDDDMQQAVSRWIARKKLSKLVEFWASGLTFDWNELYGEVKPGRVDLPVYPFAAERFWIDIDTAYRDTDAAPVAARGLDSLEDILEKIDSYALESEQAVDMLRVLM